MKRKMMTYLAKSTNSIFQKIKLKKDLSNQALIVLKIRQANCLKLLKEEESKEKKENQDHKWTIVALRIIVTYRSQTVTSNFNWVKSSRILL